MTMQISMDELEWNALPPVQMRELRRFEQTVRDSVPDMHAKDMSGMRRFDLDVVSLIRVFSAADEKRAG